MQGKNVIFNFLNIPIKIQSYKRIEMCDLKSMS